MSREFNSEWLHARESRRTQPVADVGLPAAQSEDEGELHEQVRRECERRGWVCLHGSMAARTHRTLGEPDFVILADGGRVFFVELKRRTGKLSLAQAAMQCHMRKLGHEMHVVRSLAEFCAVVASGVSEK